MSKFRIQAILTTIALFVLAATGLMGTMYIRDYARTNHEPVPVTLDGFDPLSPPAGLDRFYELSGGILYYPGALILMSWRGTDDSAGKIETVYVPVISEESYRRLNAGEIDGMSPDWRPLFLIEDPTLKTGAAIPADPHLLISRLLNHSMVWTRYSAIQGGWDFLRRNFPSLGEDARLPVYRLGKDNRLVTGIGLLSLALLSVAGLVGMFLWFRSDFRKWKAGRAAPGRADDDRTAPGPAGDGRADDGLTGRGGKSMGIYSFRELEQLWKNTGSAAERAAVRSRARSLAGLSAGEAYGDGKPSGWSRENTEIILFSSPPWGIGANIDIGTIPLLLKHPAGCVSWADRNPEHGYLLLEFGSSRGLLQTYQLHWFHTGDYDSWRMELYDLVWEKQRLDIRNSIEGGWRNRLLLEQYRFHPDGRPASRASKFPYTWEDREIPPEDAFTAYDYSVPGRVSLRLNDSTVTWELDDSGRICRQFWTMHSGYDFAPLAPRAIDYLRDGEGRITGYDYRWENDEIFRKRRYVLDPGDGGLLRATADGEVSFRWMMP